MTELTPVKRRELRATAHHLSPVVSIAGNGLTPAVIKEIDNSLQAHELIKIKVHGAERDQRETLMESVCSTLDAAPVQHIGTILVVWRKRREDVDSADTRNTGRPTKRPSTAKSAREFAATARRAALAQATADRKRKLARGPKRQFGKP